MVYWDDLGFATNYSVDAELEFPSDGVWAFPERRIATPGSELIGGPQALIRPVDADPWLLVTAFQGLGALYATGDPDVICVFEQFDRLVFVNVNDPGAQVLADVHPVRVAASVDEGLLLVCDLTGITAIAPDGIHWRSDRLVADDLHITRSDGARIYYRGVGTGGTEVRGSLDARTGDVISA
jgi:hypothetical protein